MKRRYTMEQYRADVAKLYSPQSDAAGIDIALAEVLAEGAELLPAEDEPQKTTSASQPPAKGEFVPRWSGLRKRVRRGEP